MGRRVPPLPAVLREGLHQRHHHQVALRHEADQRRRDHLGDLAPLHGGEDPLERRAAGGQHGAVLDVALLEHLVGQLHVSRIDDAAPHVEHEALVGGERGVLVPQQRKRIGVAVHPRRTQWHGAGMGQARGRKLVPSIHAPIRDGAPARLPGRTSGGRVDGPAPDGQA